MVEDPKSRQVVLRRVRNGLIDYFGTASSYDEQRDYQRSVPFVSVPHEVVNGYEDHVPSLSCLDGWGPPVWSAEEIEALRRYSRVLDAVCAQLPDSLPPLEETMRLPAWQVLRAAADEAREVFMRRGRLAEDGGGQSR